MLSKKKKFFLVYIKMLEIMLDIKKAVINVIQKQLLQMIVNIFELI